MRGGDDVKGMIEGAPTRIAPSASAHPHPGRRHHVQRSGGLVEVPLPLGVEKLGRALHVEPVASVAPYRVCVMHTMFLYHLHGMYIACACVCSTFATQCIYTIIHKSNVCQYHHTHKHPNLTKIYLVVPGQITSPLGPVGVVSG